ncbi:hypothetical protein GUITHDRAFT_138477 [Guillardia theta CCMP2712]|uniref:Uncharacterized protein n=1 Tax=Guillardia theta (strain CCMP2712) TaxID=905079 RepID=L1JBU2_GUITC|nr:hypothetical protein GUITHDRAFT_138477 [Guillardia theta CCMP2712]EKX45986.1 hypothetical protein GUITHDRAFT_138477 [Guillardia theta CCMP2712]|eukprot:XP_005832966.1 hypothetical protein GUITHDRAFT_138477 [Guillardia theta CCMP2712]
MLYSELQETRDRLNGSLWKLNHVEELVRDLIPELGEIVVELKAANESLRESKPSPETFVDMLQDREIEMETMKSNMLQLEAELKDRQSALEEMSLKNSELEQRLVQDAKERDSSQKVLDQSLTHLMEMVDSLRGEVERACLVSQRSLKAMKIKYDLELESQALLLGRHVENARRVQHEVSSCASSCFEKALECESVLKQVCQVCADLMATPKSDMASSGKPGDQQEYLTPSTEEHLVTLITSGLMSCVVDWQSLQIDMSDTISGIEKDMAESYAESMCWKDSSTKNKQSLVLLEQDKKELEETVEALKRKHGEYENEMTSLREEREEFLRAGIEMQHRVAQLREQSAELQERLLSEERKNFDMYKKDENQSQNVSRLQGMIRVAENDLVCISKQVEEALSEAVSLKESVIDTHSQSVNQADVLEEINRVLQVKVKDLEENIRRAEECNKALEGDKATWDERERSMESEMMMMEEKMKMLQGNNQTLVQHVELLQESLRSLQDQQVDFLTREESLVCLLEAVKRQLAESNFQRIPETIMQRERGDLAVSDGRGRIEVAAGFVQVMNHLMENHTTQRSLYESEICELSDLLRTRNEELVILRRGLEETCSDVAQAVGQVDQGRDEQRSDTQACESEGMMLAGRLNQLERAMEELEHSLLHLPALIANRKQEELGAQLSPSSARPMARIRDKRQVHRHMEAAGLLPQAREEDAEPASDSLDRLLLPRWEGEEDEIASSPSPSSPDGQRAAVHASLPHPRLGCSAVVVGGSVFVAGGISSDGVLSSLLVWELLDGSWRSLPSMQQRRKNFQVVAHQNRIFALGGEDEDGHVLSSVEMFDLSANRWTSCPPLQQPRSDFFACSHPVMQGMVMIAGGWDGEEILKSVEFYMLEGRRCKPRLEEEEMMRTRRSSAEMYVTRKGGKVEQHGEVEERQMKDGEVEEIAKDLDDVINVMERTSELDDLSSLQEDLSFLLLSIRSLRSISGWERMISKMLLRSVVWQFLNVNSMAIDHVFSCRGEVMIAQVTSCYEREVLAKSLSAVEAAVQQERLCKSEKSFDASQEKEETMFVAQELKRAVMVLEHEKQQAECLIRDLSMHNKLIQEKLSTVEESRAREAIEIGRTKETGKFVDECFVDKLEVMEHYVTKAEQAMSLSLQPMSQLVENLNTKNLLCDDIARDLIRYQELTLELSSEVEEIKSKECLLAQELQDYQQLAIGMEQELKEKENLLHIHEERYETLLVGMKNIAFELSCIKHEMEEEHLKNVTSWDELQTMRQRFQKTFSFDQDLQPQLRSIEVSSEAISSQLSQLHLLTARLTTERDHLRSQVHETTRALLKFKRALAVSRGKSLKQKENFLST